MTRLRACRSIFTAAAVLLAWTAAAIGVWVIAAVRADTFPLAAPDRAVPAFRVAVALAGIAAAGFLVLAVRARERGAVPVGVATVATFVALVLVLALVDAAFAFAGHGPAMRGTAVLLFVCAGDTLLAAALGLAAAVRLPRRA